VTSLAAEPTKPGPIKLGNKRVTGKEQFYTPPAVAGEVLYRILSKNSDLRSAPFLEPAGGTGAFVEAAKAVGFGRVISMDIEPRHPEVTLGNFLTMPLSLEGAVCVTNPPFGRNNSLSIPFFNQAAKYCDLIAFIVPRSWRKWSVINRLDLGFHLVDDWNLEIDYLNQDGDEVHGSGNLRTCVQVWRRDPLHFRDTVKVPDFGVIEKSKPEDADVSFTLFGYGCGTVKEDFPRVKNSTQTYFKLIHPRALEALRSVDFSRFYNHTAYTEALGIQEINFLLNEYLGLDSRPYSLDPSGDHYLGLSKSEQGGPRDHSRIF
jgi:predicted RNA methylase